MARHYKLQKSRSILDPWFATYLGQCYHFFVFLRAISIICLLALTPFAMVRGFESRFNKAEETLFSFIEDFHGKTITGAEDFNFYNYLKSHQAVVVAARDTSCPISQKTGKELSRLEKAFAKKGVGIVYVNFDVHEKKKSAVEEINLFKFRSPYLIDRSGKIKKIFNPVTTTEVFLISKDHTLVYRGAISNKYGLSGVRAGEVKNFLESAVDSFLEGRRITPKFTHAEGCFINRAVDSQVTEKKLSYYRDVQRIFEHKCVACHRSGGVGPFSLRTYEDVLRRRDMIYYVVKNDIMPPWHIDRGYGPWLNDASLNETEKTTVLSWLKQGCISGKKEDGPTLQEFHGQWRIGKPDKIIDVGQPIVVPAEGEFPLQYRYVDVELDKDEWIQQGEVWTSHPQVLHHASLARVENFPENPKYFYEEPSLVFGFVPGIYPMRLPIDVGVKLPKKSRLIFQLHFTPRGKQVVVSVKVGLKLHRKKPPAEIKKMYVREKKFTIPPHAKNVKVSKAHLFKKPITIYGLAPHMHLRGKKMTFDLVYPSGEKKTLLKTSTYNFFWQNAYYFQNPVKVPRGSRMIVTGWYDNSSDNVLNPNPNQEVVDGYGSENEMLHGVIKYSEEKER